MPRYIMIDDASGYVWGDTGDLDGPARDETPIEACRRLDASVGVYQRDYVEHGPRYRPAGQTAYHVYRADVGGSEVVPLVWDGQDAATIAEVERLCDPVAVVTVTDYSAEDRESD